MVTIITNLRIHKSQIDVKQTCIESCFHEEIKGGDKYEKREAK